MTHDNTIWVTVPPMVPFDVRVGMPYADEEAEYTTRFTFAQVGANVAQWASQAAAVAVTAATWLYNAALTAAKLATTQFTFAQALTEAAKAVSTRLATPGVTNFGSETNNACTIQVAVPVSAAAGSPAVVRLTPEAPVVTKR
mgnify:CR=1 FL=1